MKDYDEKSYCPKCQGEDIHSHWLPHDDHRWLHHISEVACESREHIRRRCGRCNYQWNELPLDSCAALEGKE